MANLSYNLREPKATKPTLIYLVVRFHNQKLKMSTGESILPTDWNTKRQKAKAMASKPEYVELNAILENITSDANKAIYALKNDLKPSSRDQIKQTLSKVIRGDRNSSIPNLMNFISALILTSPKSPNTLKNYKQTYTKLSEYQSEYGISLEYDSINIDFYNRFMKWLYERNYSTNTIGTLVKNIKVFMNEAADRGYHQNVEYRNRKFKVVEEVTDTVYLTETELDQIYDADFSNWSYLDRARDLFMVGCYTGLRFSDLRKLKKENFSNKGLLKIKTQKTGEVVIIPLNSKVLSIYKKYKGEIPVEISNQKQNEYLKEIAQIAGINQDVMTSITKGGIKTQITTPKYKVVSTHTARRSFATNAYLNDVPVISIMKITGHKTEKSFLKYIRISNEENAQKLMNHKFFK